MRAAVLWEGIFLYLALAVGGLWQDSNTNGAAAAVVVFPDLLLHCDPIVVVVKLPVRVFRFVEAQHLPRVLLINVELP